MNHRFLLVLFALVFAPLSRPNPLFAQKSASRSTPSSKEQPPHSTVAPPEAQPIGTIPVDPTVDAIREYQRTGIARPVQSGDYLAFPYGKSQPILRCAALRVCMIQLQDGEQLTTQPMIGDSERWIVQVAPSGANGNTPLVMVKPTDCDITTNLVLATNKRIYDLSLDSPSCNGPKKADDPHLQYTRRVKFYYPDEDLARFASTTPVAVASGVDRLNFDYKISKDRRFPWTPTHVFDDGEHVYIRLPAQALHEAAPVLFLLDDNGNKSLLNYSTSSSYYVTDRVFRRAILVLSEDGKERTLTMENQRGH